MGAGLIAAGDPCRAARRELSERGHGVGHSMQPRSVARGADDEKVVVHHQLSVHEVARIDVRPLGLRCMGQHHVRVSPAPHGERLPAADGDDFDAIPGALLEDG